MGTGPEAFYLPLDDHTYEPTAATESPWDSRAQHGGPPSALLGHVIDRAVGPGLRMGRISVDFLAPIPRLPARVELTTLRPGRSVHLTQADMIIDGRTAVTARAWHIATGPTPPVRSEPVAPPALPAPAEEDPFAGREDWGYGQAIEWRFVRGGFTSPGTAQVWTRVRIPLVAGEKLTGAARALIVADSANGLSAVLPMDEWLSIPPTMTATLLRHSEDDWTYMDCGTELSDDGLGLTRAVLSDAGGRLGEVAQPLLVRRR